MPQDMQRYFLHLDKLAERKTLERLFFLTGMDRREPYSVCWEEGEKRISYDRMKETAMRYAAALRRLTEGKVRRGYAGLKLDNSPKWGAIFWGLLAAGFKPVLIGAATDPRGTAYILRQAGAVALVASATDGDFGIPVFTPEQLEAAFGREEDFTATWADEVAFCSSGTMTEPRIYTYNGQALTAVMEVARAIPAASRDIMYPDGQLLRNMAILPFHHIFGFVAVFLWYTFFGKTLAFPRSLDPDTLLEDCRRLRVTHIYGVPLLWNRVANTLEARGAERGIKGMPVRRILRRAEALREGRNLYAPPGFLLKAVQKRAFGTDIRYMISGGGTIDSRTLSVLNAMGYPLHNGYGLTEAGILSVDTETNPVLRTQGSIGRPLEGVEYRIEPIGEKGEYGELMIRGEMLHTARLIRGTKEAPERDGEGWFATGDLVSRFADGRYRIAGRSKDVIINASGENILPDELETHFNRLPHAEQICVLGLSGSGGREEIVLVVQPEEGATREDLSDMRDRIFEANEELAFHRRVRSVLLAEEPIPVVNTIKVQRQKLKNALEDQTFRCIRMVLRKDAALCGARVNRIDPALVETVRSAFAEALKIDEETMSNTAHFVYDFGGDSFAYAGVMQTLTQNTGLTIPAEDYGRCATVNDFAAALQKIRDGQTQAP